VYLFRDKADVQGLAAGLRLQASHTERSQAGNEGEHGNFLGLGDLGRS
jgi:hypothetical protein